MTKAITAADLEARFVTGESTRDIRRDLRELSDAVSAASHAVSVCGAGNVIGLCIRNARKRRGVSQAEAARRVGVTRSTMCDFEHGRAIPSLVTAINLAGVLDMTLDEVFPM